ncbi:serine hydrolase [Kaistia adipata]|uniref:serine hydrolase n=1 Tax=Kaistia adipata TaxID=166954 RepID=UPI00042A8B1F|nr:serine hydrolase [Kaistia adipata]
MKMERTVLAVSRGDGAASFHGPLVRALFVGCVAIAATSPVDAETAPAPLAIPLELGAIPPKDMIALAPDGIEKGIAALPAIVGDTMKRSGVPGMAVAVVHGGKTVFAQGFGVRELGKDALVDPQTVFQIASLSKPIAGTVAAIAVTRGTVSWDDKVARFLPSFALAEPYLTANATIGDFYAHRSGLPLAAGDDLEDLGFDRKTILERLRLLPLDRFRISYHYTNFGITLGAEAVAAASGLAWEDLAATALFVPLGMASTSSRHADFLGRKNRTVLHALENGRFQPLYDRNADAQSPAGGVSSNVVDLAEWLKLLLSGGEFRGARISPEALAPMLRAQAFSAPAPAPDARSGFYGYGFNVGVDADGRPRMSHSGAFVLGGATNMQMIPSAGVAIVVLTNAGPVGAAETVATQFMDFAQYGASTRDWFKLYHPLLLNYYEPAGDLVDAKPPTDPIPASAPTAYVGTYRNDYFGPASIDLDGQDLYFSAGPKAARLKLSHRTDDEFSVAPRGENQPFGSLSSVKFTVKDGKAVSFTVGYLDGNGMGTWRR